MAEAMEAPVVHEDWDQFFRLDNQDTLLDTISTKDEDTSPQVPSLEFFANSTGSSSPSEIEHFSAQLSPVYQLPPPMESPTRAQGPNPKKRKSTDGTAAPTNQRQPRGQKISHNVIEKRYRSNLNDKIARLRDSVPELRTATPTVKRRPAKAHASDSEGSGDEGNGLKFNKATVLTKATEYIQQLERQNQKLASELSVLRNRTGPVEKLRNPPAISTSVVVDYALPAASSAQAPSTAPSTNGGERSSPTDTAMTSPGLIRVPEDVRRLREEAKPEQHYAASLPGCKTEMDQQPDPFSQPIQGLIPVPESFRRLREEAAAQDHFAPESSYYSSLTNEDEVILDDEDNERSNWPRSKALSRVLIGSLAGLMVMEGFSEREEDMQGLDKRGLFALPSELLTESRGFRAQIRQRIIHFAASAGPKKALPFVLAGAILFLVCVIAFISLAPKRSKVPREASAESTRSVDPQPTATASTLLAQPCGHTMHRTYSPPPDAFEPEAPTWDLQLIDRLTMEWFGVSIPSRGVDEEAARRAVTPRRDLKALRTIVQRLFLQRSAS
jgi:Helix-loop-helix DNA-binding domain